jgi:hypothetical protein
LEARYFRSQRNSYESPILVKVEPKNSLEEQEDEFFLNGKLYDVVEKKVGEDSVYYYAVEDANEEQAVSQLSKHFNNENSNSSYASIKPPVHFNSTSGGVILFVVTLFVLHPPHQCLISPIDHWKTCYSTGFSSVQPHPPKKISSSQLL